MCGPGGVYMGLDYDHDNVHVNIPVDSAATIANLTYIYDVYPWRAPKNHAPGQSFPFWIGGANFQNLSK